jgi:hypothetical protein
LLGDHEGARRGVGIERKHDLGFRGRGRAGGALRGYGLSRFAGRARASRGHDGHLYRRVLQSSRLYSRWLEGRWGWRRLCHGEVDIDHVRIPSGTDARVDAHSRECEKVYGERRNQDRNPSS